VGQAARFPHPSFASGRRLGILVALQDRQGSVMDLVAQPLWVAVTVFAVTAAVIAAAGTVMAQVADRLADRTGFGEAITGGVLLGASTSLSGFITSVSTAAQGYADLALSNAVGGIAVQTAFLAVADITYRRANL